MDREKNRKRQVRVPCPPKENVIPRRILVFIVKDLPQARIAPTRTAISPAVPKLTALLVTPPEVLPAELPAVVVGEEEGLDDERTEEGLVVGVETLVEVGVVVGVEVLVTGERELELLAGSEEEPDGRLAEPEEEVKQSLVPF